MSTIGKKRAAGASAPPATRKRAARERSPDVDLFEWLEACAEGTLTHLLSHPTERAEVRDAIGGDERNMIETIVRSVVPKVIGTAADRLSDDYAATIRSALDIPSRLDEALRYGQAFARETVGDGRMTFKRELNNRTKQEQIAAALRDGLSPTEAFKRAGVSRATGYRILNRPHRKT